MTTATKFHPGQRVRIVASARSFRLWHACREGEYVGVHPMNPAFVYVKVNDDQPFLAVRPCDLEACS